MDIKYEVLNRFENDSQNYYSPNTLENYMRTLKKFFTYTQEPLEEISARKSSSISGK